MLHFLQRLQAWTDDWWHSRKDMKVILLKAEALRNTFRTRRRRQLNGISEGKSGQIFKGEKVWNLASFTEEQKNASSSVFR